MASTQLYINNPLFITQNANVYGASFNEGTFDYVLRINLAGINSNMSYVFSNAKFAQNSTNIDAFDVNLTLDNSATFTDWESLFNNESIVTLSMGNSNKAFSTLQPNVLETIGDRLLEMVAHKLFGHGQARAAIKNDTEFYNHNDDIWDHLATSVENNVYRNDIFNQYVASGRYNVWNQTNGVNDQNNLPNNGDNDFNDVNRWVQFNFDGLTFDYPLYLDGNILTDASLTNDERNVLQNGPDVGGTLLRNGVYNIPILVRFHT
jgi:hypothetical protein